jgi:hypothetical protein
MTRYSHLPIFQSCYDLNLEIHRRVDNFPRACRYSMGERLKNISLDLLELTVKANSQKDKIPFLENMENLLEKLKIMIRTCFDLKIMGEKGFEFLIKKMDEIGRQLHGWKEWSEKKAN